MKFKGFLSIILIICMLCSIQCISVFANNTDDSEEIVNIVSLLATFNEFKGEEMTTEDNVNFVIKTNLEAGSYQFNIEENGELLGHATTVKDTTARISAKGLSMSENVDARCTLLSTGGTYTFAYNTESNLLSITKDGVSAPANSGESLVVKAGAQQITANTGDRLTYNIYLKASDVFEDIQLVVNYDDSKLTLTDTTAEECCPILFEPIFNINSKGLVAANSSKIEGYDFKDEKRIVTLEFTVTGTGEAYVDFIVQDMTIYGGEKSYYFLSEKLSEGATFTEELAKVEEDIPTTPSTEPTETPSEVPSTNATDSTDATVPATSGSTDIENSTPSTEPTETTVTTPATSYKIGDVNRDGKLNIRDATLIQKVLAKLDQFDTEQLILADYLADGKVNIKDATQIQKKLANLI